MLKRFFIACASAALILSAGAAAKAAEVTIRFPVEYSLDITPGLANQEFKKLVEERSKGRVEVKLFPSGSLYKGLDLLQALLRGDAEMSTLISAYWSALSPKLAVSELPYAFPTVESFYKAIDDGFFQAAYSEVEGKGAKLVTYHRSWPNFMERFGLVVIGYVEPKPGIPPSPSHTLELIAEMKRQGVRLIVVEPYFDKKTPQAIATQVGGQVLELAPSVGGQPGTEDYIKLFDYNVRVLSEALRANTAK